MIPVKRRESQDTAGGPLILELVLYPVLDMSRRIPRVHDFESVAVRPLGCDGGIYAPADARTEGYGDLSLHLKRFPGKSPPNRKSQAESVLPARFANEIRHYEHTGTADVSRISIENRSAGGEQIDRNGREDNPGFQPPFDFAQELRISFHRTVKILPVNGGKFYITRIRECQYFFS